MKNAPMYIGIGFVIYLLFRKKANSQTPPTINTIPNVQPPSTTATTPIGQIPIPTAPTPSTPVSTNTPQQDLNKGLVFYIPRVRSYGTSTQNPSMDYFSFYLVIENSTSKTLSFILKKLEFYDDKTQLIFEKTMSTANTRRIAPTKANENQAIQIHAEIPKNHPSLSFFVNRPKEVRVKAIVNLVQE